MKPLRVAIIVTIVVAIVVAIVAVVLLVGNDEDADETTNPTVTTAQGVVRGIGMTTINERAVYGFLGIPYAEPPVGELRFAAPVAKESWSGVLDTSEDAEICAQAMFTTISGNEDCLYLNVFTPQLPDDGNATLLPVLFFIHGGAFQSGNGRSSSFGPTYLLDKDMILVVPNYRVGALGFLSTGDEVAPGNFGLKDQLLALEWVRENVAYFGGDPDRVTVAGQSSGSACAHLLALSERSTGLFHQLITLSGNAQAVWAQQPRDTHAQLAYTIGESVGCSNETTTILVECLRATNVSEILVANSQLTVWNSLPPITWSPTVEPEIDGAVLTDTVANLLDNGKDADIPWLGSVVTNEGLVNTAGFYTDSTVFEEFLADFDNLLPYLEVWQQHEIDTASMTAAVKAYYFNNDLTANRTELFPNITNAVSYDSWRYPLKLGVDRYETNKTSPVYLFSFGYRGTFSFSWIYTGEFDTDFGAVHTDDALYIFPSISGVFSSLNATLSEDDLAMKDTLVEIISSFVSTGVPSVAGLQETWDPYTASQDNYLQVGNGSSTDVFIQYSFTDEQMQFWIDTVAANSSIST